MLLFVLVFYTAVFIGNAVVQKKQKPSEIGQSQMMKPEEFKQKEENFKKNILKKPQLAGALSLGAFLLLGVGFFIDMRFVWGVVNKRKWVHDGLAHQAVTWNSAHVMTAAVFMFFAESILMIVEALFFFVAGGKNVPRDFLLMANSLLRDTLVAFFIVYFVTRRLGRRLSDLGLTLKDFFKNVVRGVIGYVAVLPPLLLSLILMAVVVKFFSYEPPPQNVVQIYLKRSSDPYLLFFTLFVAGAGPIIEEIFFRGFTYKAFRQQLGIPGAMVLTSVIFAAFHMNLAAFFPIFLLGLFLCYLYEETGSLVPSMTAHMLHNLLMVSFTLGFKSIAG